jgi:hypothetical protein
MPTAFGIVVCALVLRVSRWRDCKRESGAGGKPVPINRTIPPLHHLPAPFELLTRAAAPSPGGSWFTPAASAEGLHSSRCASGPKQSPRWMLLCTSWVPLLVVCGWWDEEKGGCCWLSRCRKVDTSCVRQPVKRPTMTSIRLPCVHQQSGECMEFVPKKEFH